jgi:hypothetical protein
MSYIKAYSTNWIMKYMYVIFLMFTILSCSDIENKLMYENAMGYLMRDKELIDLGEKMSYIKDGIIMMEVKNKTIQPHLSYFYDTISKEIGSCSPNTGDPLSICLSARCSRLTSDSSII